MKYKWLQKQNNDKLIVFFNGWGMDENIVSHLDCEDFDIVIFYDYNSLETDIDLPLYKEKYIVGWSMGVMVSCLEETKQIREGAKSYIAVCGTPLPVNNDYGIPEKIYNMTIRGFNELSSKKFISRMFTEKTIPETVTKRTLDSQKSELIQLLKYQANDSVKFDKVIVAEKDIIIPTKNQLNYWNKTDTDITFIHSGHCPFLLYNKWAELVEICKRV